jgi:CHAD domain-containing protein
MATLSGEELRGPEELRVPAAARRLDEALRARGLRVSERDSRHAGLTYLDTFDGRLRAAGLVAIRTGDGASCRLALVDADSGSELVAGHGPSPGRSNGSNAGLLALELAPGALREALLPLVDVRVLLPLVTLQSELTELAVLDDESKTVARATLESARPAEDARDAKGGGMLPVRLRIEPMRGYAAELAAVGACARAIGFTVPRHRLVDEAVLLAGGRPGGTSAPGKLELLGTQRADAAAVGVLRRLLDVIEDNLPGTLEDLDAEFLHDLRVAVRRTRSVLRELRAVFPAEELARFRDEFKWVQRVTGPARDLDVYVLGWEEMVGLVAEGARDDLEPVRAVLRERRERAHKVMASELRSERMTRLRRDWDAFLEDLVALPLAGREAAERSIEKVAGERITRLYRRIVKMGRAIDENSPPEAYHDVRKKGKELRYLLELFGASLFPKDVVSPMVKTLKALQDVLGRHQDREVQRHTLREVAEQVAGRPGRTDALMAMGVLLERLHEDELAARTSFAERYAAFSKKSLRRRVKETFP